MKFSVVIPAHNEVASVGETVQRTASELERAGIDYEIVVVDDASGDGTGAVVQALAAANPNVRYLRSPLPPGFGHAVRAGLDVYTGDAVAIVMAGRMSRRRLSHGSVANGVKPPGGRMWPGTTYANRRMRSRPR